MVLDDKNLNTGLTYFYKWEKERPNDIFIKQPFGDNWKTWTYKEAGQEARSIAAALQAKGLKPGAHIGLISKNSAHWILADLAIMMGGYASVPLYPTLTSEQLNLVLRLGDVDLLMVGKLDEWEEKREGVPNEVPIIHFPRMASAVEVKDGESWDDLVAAHEGITGTPEQDINNTWTIIFTSGTTGTPKGVVHTFRNYGLNIKAQEINDDLSLKDMGDKPRFFSFLPLNHIAERAAVETAVLMSGGSVAFAESLDTFGKNLSETMPHLFFAVPRIWQKFQLKLLQQMPQKKLNRLLSIPILKNVVKKKIRKALGLNEAVTILTGASMMPPPLISWFQKLGINIREAYGMTENMGGFTVMPKDKYVAGTVGKPMGFSEVKLDEDTGEIMMKQPWLMTGYYKSPELSAEVLEDGWLRTGDKGALTDGGYLRIIGRVKDAFKTAKAQFVVPTKIEKKFSGNEFIEHICVAGLGLAQPVALVALSEIGLAADNADVEKRFKEDLARVNGELANYEKVSTVIVTKDEWGVENSLLTPTLKLRRGAIQDKWGDQMEEWCDCADHVVWEN